jgi:hypothetical protein
MNAIVARSAELQNPASADLDAAAQTPTATRAVSIAVGEAVTEHHNLDEKSDDQQLAPLFLPDVATGFRLRWDTVQRSFVDDPKQAVRQGDELVSAVIDSLTETFTHERAKLEGELDQTGNASTETLRVALRRYRSFLERLLSL